MSDSENDSNASKIYEVESVLGRRVARNGEVCKSMYIGCMKNILQCIYYLVAWKIMQKIYCFVTHLSGLLFTEVVGLPKFRQ